MGPPVPLSPLRLLPPLLTLGNGGRLATLGKGNLT